MSFTTTSLATIVNADMKEILKRQEGAVSGLLIANIVLILFVMVFGSIMIWALVNYNDQKANVDAKIEVAVAEAKKVQATEDEQKFAEQEKAPYRDFVGPVDLGRVTFTYPKTWSVYVGKEGQAYEAYFYPISVPPIDSKRPYALRVSITDKTYERSIDEYESAVKKGELKSSPITVNGYEGNRLDGKFTKETDGSMVLFKIRDKTLKMYTESPNFKADFDNIILKSFNFNP